jgi:hypothetical protein
MKNVVEKPRPSLCGVVTELDEIVLVAKMAWALRLLEEPSNLEEANLRRHLYRSRGLVDLDDYSPDLALRLDRKAAASEKHRRALVQTKVLA